MTAAELILRMTALETGRLEFDPNTGEPPPDDALPAGVRLLRRERLALEAALATGERALVERAADSAERVALSLSAFWGVSLVPPARDSDAPADSSGA